MTCLILTRNRRPWLPCALQCVEHQTYRNRETLVVSSGDPVTDLIPPQVRHLHLPGKPLIGQSRNAGCEAARGDVIAHFDDDDFSGPERVADQVARLRESGKVVTGYHSMRFTDGRQWWRYRGAACYALGTSLCYRRDWWLRNPFDRLQVGEDNAFVMRARAADQLIAMDAGELMWATIHPGNTSPRQLNNTDAWRLL